MLPFAKETQRKYVPLVLLKKQSHDLFVAG
jgi:hypothetical protein